MRFALRFLIPLLLLLVLIAWGASAVATRSARAWAERDLRARARLVHASSRQTLERSIAAADRSGTRALLEALLRDERLIAASVCDPGLRTLASVGDLPPQARCESRRAQQSGLAQGLDESVELKGGTGSRQRHPSLRRGPRPSGFAVLIHDLVWLTGGSRELKQNSFGCFAGDGGRSVFS